MLAPRKYSLDLTVRPTNELGVKSLCENSEGRRTLGGVAIGSGAPEMWPRGCCTLAEHLVTQRYRCLALRN